MMTIAVFLLIVSAAGCGHAASQTEKTDEFVGTWQDTEYSQNGYYMRLVFTKEADGYRVALLQPPLEPSYPDGAVERNPIWMNLTRDGDRLKGRMLVNPGKWTLGWTFRLIPSTGHLRFMQWNNKNWQLKLEFERLSLSTFVPSPTPSGGSATP